MMTWFKPAAWAFVLGSVVTMIVGFSWGGWLKDGWATVGGGEGNRDVADLCVTQLLKLAAK